MSISVTEWDPLIWGEITLENIKKRYYTGQNHRISETVYSLQTCFEGWAIDRYLYCLEGAFNIEIEDRILHFSARTFAFLPKGQYKFSGLNSSFVKLVTVFMISEDLWKI